MRDGFIFALTVIMRFVYNRISVNKMYPLKFGIC